MMKKYVLALGAILTAAAGGFWLGHAKAVAAANDRVFEIRFYTASPGKLDALNARFRDRTSQIFKRLNMTSVGYFIPMDNPLSKNTLIYIMAFPDRDSAKKAWDQFDHDSEWLKVKQETDAGGALTAHIDSIFTNPTDYSPLK